MSTVESTAATNGNAGHDGRFQYLRTFAAALAAAGLRHVCITPGARSTPLTACFAGEANLRCWSHIDERSAAFFALGIAVQSRTPTALICTSGTAAANFFPAVIEAAQTGVPLIVLTADRPPELRDCEAGQTIDQIKLFGGFTKWFAEVGADDCGEAYFRSLAQRAVQSAGSHPRGVIHLNIPLREPLLPGEPTPHRDDEMTTRVVATRAAAPLDGEVSRLASEIAACRRVLILCGPANHSDDTVEAIGSLAQHLQAPILADPTSQARRSLRSATVVDCYESLMARSAFADANVPDLVIRFGGYPTCKPLRLWLERAAVPQIVIEPRGRWNDPSRLAREMWHTDIGQTCGALQRALPTAAEDCQSLQNGWRQGWQRANHSARATIADYSGAATTLSGAGTFARLAQIVPARSTVFVGNSLPIRQLESVWPATAAPVRFLCNRGANGIDGIVSTILGSAAASNEPVVGVLGDLSLYHDLNGLMAARRYSIDATIIVLNNDGGGIFSMLPQTELGPIFEHYFTTPHGLDFEHAAALYGCSFSRVDSWTSFETAVRQSMTRRGTDLIEVPIEAAQDLEFSKNMIATAAAALDC